MYKVFSSFVIFFFFVVVGIEPRALGTTNLTPNSSFVKLSTIFHLMNYDGLLDHYPEISWVFFSNSF